VKCYVRTVQVGLILSAEKIDYVIDVLGRRGNRETCPRPPTVPIQRPASAHIHDKTTDPQSIEIKASMNVTVGSDQDENGQDLGVYSIVVGGSKDGVGAPPAPCGDTWRWHTDPHSTRQSHIQCILSSELLSMGASCREVAHFHKCLFLHEQMDQ
jgi:hypothetical protein